jgi:hypothetical protein
MSMRSQSRRLGVLVVAATVAGAGCGGHVQRSTRPRPQLPHTIAVQLAAISDDVARKLEAGDNCAALAAARTLQQETIRAINSGRVPARLQETLQSTATDLAGRIRCVPPPQPSVTPPLPPPTENRKHEHKDHGKHKGHGGDEGD